MDKSKFVKSFRRVYPERDIRILNICPKDDNNTAILTASFPDGTFTFEVGENFVSSAN